MNIHYRLSIRVYVIHNTSDVHICCMCCILVIYCVCIYVCLYLLIFALLKGGNKEQHICDNGKSPITAISTIYCRFSFLFPAKRSTKLRLSFYFTIFTFSLLTLVLPALKFLICYYYVDLANNNISTGLSGLVVGWEARRMEFNVFGGPFIAIGLYLVIGWTFILTPTAMAMADHLYIGNIDGHETQF